MGSVGGGREGAAFLRRLFACPCTGAGRRGASGGFSLVEVTMALGVTVFVSVTILALLPTGLNVMREAMHQTVEAQILRSMAGQAVVSNFETLTDGSPFFFDEEGLPLGSGLGAVYTATLSRHDAAFPGLEHSSGRLAESLAVLRIEIQEQRGGEGSVRTRAHSLHVANEGK